MRRHLAWTALTAALTGLTGLPAVGWSANFEQAAPPDLVGVRVIYLQEMAPIDAMKLVRSQAQVPRAAVISDRGVIIVAGAADTLDRCETVLREHGAVLRVADPHAPQEMGSYAPDSLVPRVFRVGDDSLQGDDDLQAVVVVLRGIYSIRLLSEYPPDNTVSVEAPQPVLDAIEALLRELKLLAPASQSDGKS